MDIKAKKHLGQNFLKNPIFLERIVGDDDLSDISVLEIGPGPGDLTAEILRKRPASLTLVELDDDMIPLLQRRFDGENIDIIQTDVLSVDIVHGEPIPHQKSGRCTTKNLPKNYRVYGNIPYYITSPIIYHFLHEITQIPTVMILTMQKEVADRILAREGKHSVLSLACQLVSDVSRVCDISPGNFTPVPKVWSTCLRFDLRDAENREITRDLLTMIELGFSQKRKKLLSNLSQRYSKEVLKKTFEQLQIDENVRAEDLDIGTWKKLFKNLI